MGIESDYAKQIEQDKQFDRDFILKEKLNKEDISTIQMATLFRVDARTIRNRLEKLCDIFEDELSIDDFRDGKKYSFKPTWNGILAVLLSVTDTPEFDKRKTQHTLEGYYNFLQILMDSVTNFLGDVDRRVVMSHGTYVQAMLEKEYYEKMITRLETVIDELGMMPASLKLQTMAGLYDTLGYIHAYLAKASSIYELEKIDYMNYNLEGDSSSVSPTSFKEDLGEYLVTLLSLRLQGEEDLLKSLNLKAVGSTLTENLLLMGNVVGDKNVKGLNSLMYDTVEDIAECTEVKQILERIAGVLDLENDMEQNVYHWIQQYIIDLSTKNKIVGDSHDISKELIRKAVTKEMVQGLRDFNS